MNSVLPVCTGNSRWFWPPEMSVPPWKLCSGCRPGTAVWLVGGLGYQPVEPTGVVVRVLKWATGTRLTLNAGSTRLKLGEMTSSPTGSGLFDTT